jgi:hypothetical protein
MSYDGPHAALPRLSVLLRRCRRAAVGRTRALSFWVAVGLPWVLLGFAVSGHVARVPEVFAGLVAVTVLCGFLGRDYRR